jgi:hypothetical protein
MSEIHPSDMIRESVSSGSGVNMMVDRDGYERLSFDVGEKEMCLIEEIQAVRCTGPGGGRKQLRNWSEGGGTRQGSSSACGEKTN